MRKRAFVNLTWCVVAGSLFGISPAGAEQAFRVGLWGASGPNRVQAFQGALEEALGEDLAAAGFGSIEVESTGDFDRRYEQLGEARYALLEADPATYFLARRRGGEAAQRWQYDLLFQTLPSATSSTALRGVILCRDSSEMQSLGDLRGRVLGILSDRGLAYGGIQLSALGLQGLERHRNLHVLQSDTEANLCKALLCGFVDAIALPEGRALAFFQKEGLDLAQHGGLKALFRSEPLPGPVWCIHRQLARNNADLVARLRCFFPALWEEEFLVPSRDSYYVTLQAWVQARP